MPFIEHLHLLEHLHIDDPPSTVVYETPQITNEKIFDAMFPKKCAGCDRIFASPENYTQHFFCPWMGNTKVAKRYQKIVGYYSPIANSLDKKIYTPNEFAKELISAWETRYSEYETWDFLVQLYSSRLLPIQENINYYLPNDVYQALINPSVQPFSSEDSASSQVSLPYSQVSSQISLHELQRPFSV